MISFFVEGKPAGTNNCYKKRGHGYGLYMTKEGSDWKETVGWEAKRAMAGDKIMTEDCTVSLTFYWKDRRKHDIDSCIKFLLDAMQGIVYENDNQVRSLAATKHYSADPAVKQGVLITVE